MSNPKIFVGSSTEGLDIGRNIQLNLNDVGHEIILWNEGVFGLLNGTLEDLVSASGEYNFAILVLTGDDVVMKRGEALQAPRDNVLFELGLFMGRLGRSKTFIVPGKGVKLPSDLAGVTVTKPVDTAAENQLAAVGPACTQIRQSIRDLEKKQPRLQATQDYQNILNSIFMSSWDEIYSRAHILATSANHWVRATAFGSGQWEGDLRYLEAIAMAAARQKEKKSSFIHRVVYSRRNVDDAQRRASMLARLQVFKEYDVQDQLKIGEIDENWGFDMLIVDNQHLHVSFQQLAARNLALGIEISDSPEIVHPIAEWYDTYVFEKSTAVDLDSLVL